MPLAALLLAAVALAAPAVKPPSLAKVNGLLDTARDLERARKYAAVIPVYAAILAELGESPPRHMLHIGAKALVQTGNAQLATGHLPEAQAAYRDAVARFGNTGDAAVRDHIRRASALIGRVDELIGLMGGTPAPPATPPPPATTVSATRVAEKEPLILLTERKTGPGEDDRGFEVKSFDGDEASLIRDAERRATPDGRKVLETGRDMALTQRLVLPGSCWDYIDQVFARAGYPESRRKRAYKAVKKGPYTEASRLQPGDWMYYVNHSFGNSEHSGIFVGWINGPSKVALVLSYPGQNRAEPGRYRPYELTAVYTIWRPSPVKVRDS